MKIQITQQHIDDGQWTNPLRSPITLALKEAGFKSVLTFRDNVHMGRYKIPLPKYLFMAPLEPFEFEIKLPLLLRLKCLFK